MPKATQLTLSHQNRPGMLAHIAKVLGDAKVNILAYLTTTSGSEGLTQAHRGQCGRSQKGVCEGWAWLHRGRCAPR
jgi:ACT domain